MKVLRAIGGFFAKIGRWIANTAWIQPLLIVGGIFGIIFSIPYIKQAIDKSKIDNTDYEYEWFKNPARSLSLEEDGGADKLLGYITEERPDLVKADFGEKFYLSFVQKECSGCRNNITGFAEFETDFYNLVTNGEVYKHYTIVVDTMDDNGDYPAQKLFNKNQEFFSKMSSIFGEGSFGDYILSINASDQFSTIKSNLATLTDTDYITEDATGFLTPFTIMFDYNKYETEAKEMYCTGVTAVFFDYSSLMNTKDYSETSTNKAKAQFLRDCWMYDKVFSPNYKD